MVSAEGVARPRYVEFLKIDKMGMNCGCPAGAALPDINVSGCKESFGQIQKVIFQRVTNNAGEVTIPAATLASKSLMAALKTAEDGTKIVVSPYIQNPTTEPGAARTFGGGNQTLGGVEMIIGREPTNFTGALYQEPQSVISSLKKMMCENIGVYLVDENGNIGALQAGTSASTSYKPIPVGKFFVGDKKFGGYEEVDSNEISWSFFPNWSDDFVVVKATTFDYNPLTDL